MFFFIEQGFPNFLFIGPFRQILNSLVYPKNYPQKEDRFSKGHRIRRSPNLHPKPSEEQKKGHRIRKSYLLKKSPNFRPKPSDEQKKRSSRPQKSKLSKKKRVRRSPNFHPKSSGEQRKRIWRPQKFNYPPFCLLFLSVRP